MVKPGNIYFDQATHDADIHAKPDLDKARALLREAGVDPAATTIEFMSWQDTYAQDVVQMVRNLGFQVHHVTIDDLGADNRHIGSAPLQQRVCTKIYDTRGNV